MSSDNVRLVSYQENRRVSEPKILKTRQISLGKLLRMYRERDGQRLSREVLAEMVGVSSRTIRNWENDISLPTAHHLRKLIEVYLEQKLFSANEERDETQELWLKRQEYDELNTFSAFDEVWFSRLLEVGSVSKPLPSGQNKGQPSTNPPVLTVAATPTTSVEEKSKVRLPGNLPALNGPTIGRDKELAQLENLLQNPAVRLITLAGPGGVGKTRLVLQTGHLLADKFADGVFFVCLAAIEEPALVLEMIAQTLGVKEAANLSLLQSLQTYLASKKILLIIDNFEQVKRAASDLLKLVEGAANVKLLVGSRITLQIYGEYVFEVLPLTVPSLAVSQLSLLNPGGALALSKYGSVEFLLERTRQLKPDLTLTAENAQALTQICQRLDGLPLALELAAARLKFFTPPALLRRLEGAYNSSPLQILEKGYKAGPGRQQSLRQTLDWSYNLLEGDEQHLFCSLAVFNDGCSLAACETVCSNLQIEAGSIIEPSKILNLLTQLVEKSLLKHENDPDGEPRFSMLQTVRDYALERLKSSGREDGREEVLWQACTKYFVKLAETAEAQLRGPEQAIWVPRLEKEHNNLRAVLHRALDHSQVETALRLVASLCWFWKLGGYLSEGRRWAEEALAKSEPLKKDPAIEIWRGQALNGAGMLAV